MFLIFLALISSLKALRDTTFITVPGTNDTIFITGTKIWNSTGTITIEGTLSVSKVDSAIHADSAAWSDSTLYADSTGWANLFDGYSEDYFRDTNDVWRDSVHAYQEATDSLATPKVKADFYMSDDSGRMVFGDDVTFDSTVSIAEQWVKEERCDTLPAVIYLTEFEIGGGASRNMQFDQSNDRLQCSIYGITNGGEVMFSLRNLTGDSIVLDSIKSIWYTYTDSIGVGDTLWNSIDTAGMLNGGAHYAYVYTEDTLTNQSEGQHEYFSINLDVGGYSWKKNTTGVPVWSGSLKEASSCVLSFYGIIPYYESWEKRYGIPE